MIITKTPFRMSFFGGGTDFKPFFEEHGGKVISTTFDKYSYAIVRHLPRFFDYRSQLTYSKIENVYSRDEFQHPLVREAMKFLNMDELHITYDADLPARSGVGSSSAFAAGLLLAFHALKGQYISPKELAKEAIYLERELCDESGGWQDQIAVCYGGFNRIIFTGNDFFVSPLIMSNKRKEMLNDKLLLFFTGFSRFSSEIATDHTNAIKSKKNDLLEMLKLCDEGEKILVSKSVSLDDFGKLLDYTWKLKRSITDKVSTGSLDEIYDKAKKAGAIGGKLMGSGGGGFFVFYVPEVKQPAVRSALSHLMNIPFKFDDKGASVLYYQPEDFVFSESNQKERTKK